MNRFATLIVCIFLFANSAAVQREDVAFARPPETAEAGPKSTIPRPGIDFGNFDNAVRAQDDFYQHVNGAWLKSVHIPADKAKYGAGTAAFDKIQRELQSLIDEAAKGRSNAPGVDTGKIADLYASYMDIDGRESLDLQPLTSRLALIDAAASKSEIARMTADLNRKVATVTTYGLETNAPLILWIHQDNADSSKYVADFQQGGLGLPDADYYLKDSDKKLKGIRDAYRKHIEKMLAMAGDEDAAVSAAEIVALETQIARIHWNKVAMGDPAKAYNKKKISELAQFAPGFDWDAFIDALGLKGKVDTLIVAQPSYVIGFARLVRATPLTTWKKYFRWRTLSAFSQDLSKRFVDEDFAFNGRILQGIPQDRPLGERGITLVNGSIGEELGKLYTAGYFPPENKAVAQKLVSNLLHAFRQNIDRVDWMGPQTKQAAQDKLARIVVKIGYPDKWRDYSALKIERGDLVGNISRSVEFDYQHSLDKLDKPIDRGEWDMMTPQTLDAYYNAEHNEVVFPAAFLQPPYFDPAADDAVNYGSIGSVIGHEISHGFDNGGSQYDGNGNLRDWWTKDDREKFAAKTKMLVAEYSAFEPVPGYFINGQVTLGENIADNSGLAAAYSAYRISLGGKPAPVIDGLTGDQRFYIGYAQTWRAKMRENAVIALLKGDPHSPPKYRLMGTVVNQPAFYAAFGIKEGDKMYVPPNRRVVIW